MSRKLRLASLVWLGVAILLAIGSETGGDTSIVTGLLWLVWTAPFGPIWQFWVYDSALKILPANVANFLGLVLVLLIAYTFWFHFIPWLVRLGRKDESVGRAP